MTFFVPGSGHSGVTHYSADPAGIPAGCQSPVALVGENLPRRRQAAGKPDLGPSYDLAHSLQVVHHSPSPGSTWFVPQTQPVTPLGYISGHPSGYRHARILQTGMAGPSKEFRQSDRLKAVVRWPDSIAEGCCF